MSQPSEFIQLLKRYRARKRMSQEQLGYASGVDHSLVSRLESGKRHPTREAISKLAIGLQLAPADVDALLLAGEYRPESPTALIADEPELVNLYALLKNPRMTDPVRYNLRKSLAQITHTIETLLP